ncbi:hypothetical protein AB0B25_25140 [Nocardia sp. NPDC049190]
MAGKRSWLESGLAILGPTRYLLLGAGDKLPPVPPGELRELARWVVA